jgi:acyl-CoA thioester hydrolase
MSPSSASSSSEVFVIANVDAAAVAARFDDVKGRVEAAVAFAVVEHVGATAVEGLASKGDLDVQVRVPRERFSEAVLALSTSPSFRLSAGAYLPPDGQSFDVVDEAGSDDDVPAAVHVTVEGSDADEQRVFRQLLRHDDDDRAAYAALKRAFNGRPMSDYRVEKAAFFARLKQSPRFDRERALERFPWRFTLPVQWGDLDANAHVNNVVFHRWFESARGAMLKDVGFFENTPHAGVGPILHSAGVRFRLPLAFPDVVTAAVGVKDVKDDRFGLDFALFSDACRAVAATGEAVVVAFDYAAKKKDALPDSVRARLSPA